MNDSSKLSHKEEKSADITSGIGKFCSLQVHQSTDYNPMLIIGSWDKGSNLQNHGRSHQNLTGGVEIISQASTKSS